MNVHELADKIIAYRLAHPCRDLDIVGDLAQTIDREQDFLAGDNNYTWWGAIGVVFGVRSVVEIGTRYGYSVKALLAGRLDQTCQVLVVDFETNPGETPLWVFEAYFRKRDVALEIRKQDSQQLTSLNAHGFDIGSVDALHSADGCYHDCGLVWECLRPGGLMVCDDTQPGGEVREGCERFCRERGLEWTYLPSLRGIHLILKPEGGS